MNGGFSHRLMQYFICILVMVVSKGSGKRSIIKANDFPTEISCDDEMVITVEDIYINDTRTLCSHLDDSCTVTQEEKLKLQNHCYMKQSCNVSSDFLSPCLQDIGYLSITYSCEGVAARCDFENGLCGWKPSPTTGFKWKRKMGPTPNGHTGPAVDHTLSNSSGFYVYTTTYTRFNNERTSLSSPWIQHSMKQCLSFWYYMYGSDINILNVYQNKANSGNTIWTASYDKGNNWYYQAINLYGNEPYKITFEAIRGNGGDEHIAVDDILIVNRRCEVSAQDCTFEKDLCTWSVNSEEDNSWTWTKGIFPDHSIGTDEGSFAYFIKNDELSSHAALFHSSRIYRSANSCLTFWYNAFNIEKHSLEVQLFIEMERKTIWSLSSDKEETWLFADININVSSAYFIVFSANLTTPYSDIAVDDIFLFSGSCADVARSISHTTLDLQNGLLSNTMSCRNVAFSVILNECSKSYIVNSSIELDFDPTFETCRDIYSRIKSTAQVDCASTRNPEICYVRLHDYQREHQECFQPYRLVVEYKCEAPQTTTKGLSTPETNNTSDEEALEYTTSSTTNTSVEIGIVVGVVISCSGVIAIVTVFIYIQKRKKHNAKSIIKKQNKFELSDYTGNQNIALPISNNVSGEVPSKHSKSPVYLTLEKKQHDYPDEYKSNVCSKNSTSNSDKPQKGTLSNNNYAIVDPSVEPNCRKDDSYAILDPTETGFIRGQQQVDTFPSYELAKSLEKQQGVESLDPYELKEEGAYDSSMNYRHNNSSNDIYSHSVDNVYDCAGHGRKIENDNENAYDHFLGQKKDVDYDILNSTCN